MGSNVNELLGKISQILSWSGGKPLSKLEHDLLLQYIRNLYEQASALPVQGGQHIHKTGEEHQLHLHKHTHLEELIVKKFEPAEENILLNDIRPKAEAPAVKAEEPLIEKPVVKAETKPEPKPEVKVETKTEVQDIKPEGSEDVVARQQVTVKRPVNETTRAKAGSINENVKGASSLNEKVKSASTEVHKKLGSKHLKDLVDLNKRFVFVNELFRGNADAFAKALQHLDTASDYNGAENYINNELARQYEWDAEAQSTRLFYKLVKQKFGVE